MIIQLTGLSGAGKTTLATGAKSLLEKHALVTEIIDGDVYRKTLCKDLGFSPKDRMENIRRLGKLAWSFKEQTDIILIAAINPFEAIRNELRDQYDSKTVWVKCDMAVLIKRDPKKLYKRALLHDDHPDKIYNLTGVNDKYEIPAAPDLIIDTSLETPAQSVQKLYEFLLSNKKDPEGA
ncbi:adenylyl-sulfate kinase [Niastella yeongjuensis]|uniref:Adenylyl-sulfate kinase n=1 Tax=Niastella yeongjuensis TaxID=354355 RepID=A0A1V9EVV1_9BACT|nr:adenylyl-sulfate kinase [Niastella yeongjuensis]OQP50286.1 adenylyl-sulfate kinase [Niastella yeongjuensis]SEN41103.1 adenylylsulfate kinase [Niastella yeongjuensis]